MNKIEEFIVTTVKELETDPFMDNRKREAALAATKVFLFRLGHKITDDKESHTVFKKVFLSFLEISKSV